MDIRTECRNITMAPRWQQEIESRLQDLQDGHDDIVHARMTLERNRHHKKGPKIASARLLCNVRGATFTASKTEETFEEAIRTTFVAMREELQRYREKRKTKARTEANRRLPARSRSVDKG
jgi:ribosome-associated translation inhibitor RaiA